MSVGSMGFFAEVVTNENWSVTHNFRQHWTRDTNAMFFLSNKTTTECIVNVFIVEIE